MISKDARQERRSLAAILPPKIKKTQKHGVRLDYGTHFT